MEQNPYAKFLEGRDPLAVIESTPAHIVSLAARLPKEQLALAAPAEKWSAREILAHLADCETVFSFRLRQALAEENPLQQPWDQDRWATRYANADWNSALQLWQATRKWNLLLIQATTPAERQRPTHHPDRGQMVFWTIVETMAGHDINHLAQLERLATS